MRNDSDECSLAENAYEGFLCCWHGEQSEQKSKMWRIAREQVSGGRLLAKWADLEKDSGSNLKSEERGMLWKIPAARTIEVRTYYKAA